MKNRYPKVDVINSDFADIEKKPEYDIITMWDTVEHIVDQNLLFNSVKKMLRKDGLFFFSTPNTDSFEWMVANTEHVQLLPPGHVNLLNIKSISKLLKNNGFSLKNYFTLNPSLDVDYVLKLKSREKVNRLSEESYLVSLLSNEKFRGIRVSISPGQLQLSANNPEQEEAERQGGEERDEPAPLRVHGLEEGFVHLHAGGLLGAHSVPIRL